MRSSRVAAIGRRLRRDGVAGLVLGVQSVPDGLATGLLAGVSPLAGLYAYVVGTLAGAAATSSTFMVVQGTGAMAMVVADVPAVHDSTDPERALFTLSILTGAVMLAAGLLKLGSVLRFVSNAVMVGFINAVGVNIVLGQLANLTGFAADGANRVVRALNTVLSPGELDWRSVAVGLGTILLIIALERTSIGALGLVVGVIATSAAAATLGWSGVATLSDLGVDLDGLPTPTWPLVGAVPALLVPAASLAFVGLVQGAGISANFVNPDGRYPDASRDFVGQGVANVASGVMQGMPVGGSVSASAINKAAGARSRWAPIVASAVMAVVIVAFGDAVGYLAMPALAGLLILIGVRTVKPADVRSVWRTGVVQKAVLVVTFVLTMVIPLQYAVMVGVGLSVVLHVVRQSNQVTVVRRVRDADGHVIEVAPPAELPAGEVVVLQPYGSLFFAAAPVFENALPTVASTSRGTVVVLRLRGRSDLGTTFMDVVRRYAIAVREVGSRLLVVSTNERIEEQLAATGVLDVVGPEALYRGDERVGAALQAAEMDAAAWVEQHRPADDEGT
ncbi:MAG: SulP family inorganic anion transporter [Acidimicrobiales bacterium]|jgi:SulP family sulfate permease|nr:SulP family inorganic anion transporter [Acidimicrobiales bacterium]